MACLSDVRKFHAMLKEHAYKKNWKDAPALREGALAMLVATSAIWSCGILGAALAARWL